MSFLPLFLQTAASGDASVAGASTLATFVPFILIILIMYFLMIRPQSKKQKETQKMLDALKKGDKVVTIGGIHGTVSSVKENIVVVKVDDNTKIEFNRTAIASVVTDKPAQEESPAEKKSFFAKNNSEGESKVEEKKDE